MSTARILYTLILWLILPLLPLRLLWRGRRQPAYRAHWGERFGRYDSASTSQPAPIWLHAVSVGETRAAQPLTRALRARYPERRIVLTHMTPTGRETAAQLFGTDALIESHYLPYDYPFAVRGFLDRFKPAVGLIMETELWPNLIAACRARGVPLLLVNARLSARSARGYARVGALTREALANLAGISAQTAGDADRLRALGAPEVHVAGNIKFDVAPDEAQLALGATLRGRIGARRVLLCASTREGEEALLLDACDRAQLGNALLLIVPRHPQRFDEVAALVRARGLTLARRSENGDVPSGADVLLGDSMGEMFAYYAAADVAWIGGSLLPLGGQNLIEACAVGTPVMVGPHTFNFLDATEQAIAAGAALRVADAAELMREAARLLADDAARARMHDAGLEFAQAHRGATERTMALIAPRLTQAR